jgi:hypothetical protein
LQGLIFFVFSKFTKPSIPRLPNHQPKPPRKHKLIYFVAGRGERFDGIPVGSSCGVGHQGVRSGLLPKKVQLCSKFYLVKEKGWIPTEHEAERDAYHTMSFRHGQIKPGVGFITDIF